MKTHTIVIASDHAGFNLKQVIVNYCNKKNLAVKDLGTVDAEKPVDYPDYAKRVADFLAEDLAETGILICATGTGMAIAANRRTNIRAAVCLSTTMAELARAHNNANILILASKFTDNNTSINIMEKFLETKFEGGRHIARLNKI